MKIFLIGLKLQRGKHLQFKTSSIKISRAYLTILFVSQHYTLDTCPKYHPAAHMVCLTGRLEHITPLLRELHWQPVRQRISFKVLAQSTGRTECAGERTYVPRYLCSPVPMFPGFCTLIVVISINRLEILHTPW